MDRNLYVLHLLINEQWSFKEVALYCQLSETAVRKISQMGEVLRILPHEPEYDLSLIMPSLFNAQSQT